MYRIITSENKVKFVGTGKDSWFKTIEQAKENKSENDMIYLYDDNCNKLWEVL
jgi:hypothetical protein